MTAFTPQEQQYLADKFREQIDEIIRKRNLAVDELSQQQLADCIVQMVKCGDIARHVLAGHPDVQSVVYIPYRREQELELKVARLKQALREIANPLFQLEYVRDVARKALEETDL